MCRTYVGHKVIGKNWTQLPKVLLVTKKRDNLCYLGKKQTYFLWQNLAHQVNLENIFSCFRLLCLHLTALQHRLSMLFFKPPEIFNLQLLSNFLMEEELSWLERESKTTSKKLQFWDPLLELSTPDSWLSTMEFLWSFTAIIVPKNSWNGSMECWKLMRLTSR